MSPSTRIRLVSFWQYITFVANSLVFLLIGLEIDLARLWDHALIIVVAWLATALGRAVAIGLAWPILSRTKEKLPTAWHAVIWWGGLHGALSMVLAMSLPTTYQHRGLIIDLAFGTVLLSILVQGLTVGPLVRYLGLSKRSEEHERFSKLTALFHATGSALRELRQLRDAHEVSPRVADTLKAELEEQLHELEELRDEMRESSESVEKAERIQTLEHLLVVKKDALTESFHGGIIDEDALRELVGSIDAQLNDLETDGH